MDHCDVTRQLHHLHGSLVRSLTGGFTRAIISTNQKLFYLPITDVSKSQVTTTSTKTPKFFPNYPSVNMSAREGHQSPPPEAQSDAQINAPASGQGTDDSSNKEEINKHALDNLTSNPKGPLDDAVTEKFSKKKPATRAEE